MTISMVPITPTPISGTLENLTISAGINTNAFQVSKFAYNTDIDSSTEEDVWSYGGTLVRLSTAEKLVVSSTDALDIVIRGVDSLYNPLIETITLNGTTPTTTTLEFLSVYSAQISPETVSINTGNIIGVSEISSSIQFIIDIGNGQTEMCHYVVPAGYTAFLYGLHYGCSIGDDAVIRFQLATEGYSYITKLVSEVSSSATTFSLWDTPLPIPEKTWIRIKAKAKTNNTRISAEYILKVYKNEYLLK